MSFLQQYECFVSAEDGHVSEIIEKCQNHPSIKLIKAKNKNKAQTFKF